MKKKVIFLLVLITALVSMARVGSHTSGYYPGDSLVFTIDTVLPNGRNIIVSINGLPFYEYQNQQIILYKRDTVSNSWEDQPFSKGSPIRWASNEVDTLAKRGKLERVNNIWIKIINDTTQETIRDFVYNIGFGVAPLITQVFLTAGYDDLFGLDGFYGPGRGHLGQDGGIVWNYAINRDNTIGFDTIPKSVYRKWMNVQILKNNILILDQNAEASISGNSSVHLFNKTIAVAARKELSWDGNGSNMFEYVYQNDSNTHWKWFKFRTTRAHGVITGSNEIATALSKGLNQCYAPNERVEVYINGSYWNFSYMQEKINQYTYARQFNVYPNNISIMQPERGRYTFPRMYEQFFPSHDFCIIKTPWDTNRISIVGIREEGSKANFEILSKSVKRIIEMYIDSTSGIDYYDSLFNLIHLQDFIDYGIFQDYINGGDIVSNNLQIAMIPGGKIGIIPQDYDGMSSPQGIGWDYIKFQSEQAILVGSILKIIFRSTRGVDDLIRRTQDLLNFQFPQEKVDSIIQSYRQGQYTYLEKNYNSWSGFPNGGFYATTDSGMDKIYAFLDNRTEEIRDEVASYWMPQNNYNLDSINLITVDFTHVVGDRQAWLKVNSYIHRSGFSKPYYPLPTIQISIPSGYYLQEFPDSSGTFELYLTTAQKLTMKRYYTPLPVELIFFTCSQVDDGIQLRWETASEFNNSHFTIERSETGTVFDSIGFVLGTGNPSTYKFVDATGGYYRLKQIDNNREFKFSNSIDCRYTITDISQKIFPNPTNGVVTINNITGTVVVIDFLGHTILTQEIDKNNSVSLDSYPSGLYLFKIIKPTGDIITKKIFKK